MTTAAHAAVRRRRSGPAARSAVTWRKASVVPQCAHSQASAAGSSGPRRRIFSGTGSSACRSNGQARLWPTRASARSCRRTTASRSWPARMRAPARLRLRCCGGGGATSRRNTSSAMRAGSSCQGMIPAPAAAAWNAASAAGDPVTVSRWYSQSGCARRSGAPRPASPPAAAAASGPATPDRGGASSLPGGAGTVGDGSDPEAPAPARSAAAAGLSSATAASRPSGGTGDTAAGAATGAASAGRTRHRRPAAQERLERVGRGGGFGGGLAAHAVAVPAGRRPAWPAAGEKNAAERVGAEPAVLDGAPAVDLAEHRAEPRVGEVEPAAQRLHRAGGQGRAVRNRHGAPAVPVRPRLVDGEVDRRCGEPDMFGVEADQRGAAEASGGEQQQGAVAHAGKIARAGGGHAPQLGRWRRARPSVGGAAAGRSQQRGDRGIGGGGGRGRPRGGGRRSPRRGGRARRRSALLRVAARNAATVAGVAGSAAQPLALAPGGEAGPVGGVEPGGLGGRRAAGRRGRGRAGRDGGVRRRVTHPASPCVPSPGRAVGLARPARRRPSCRASSAGSGRLRQAWQRRGKRFCADLARRGVPADSVR